MKVGELSQRAFINSNSGKIVFFCEIFSKYLNFDFFLGRLLYCIKWASIEDRHVFNSTKMKKTNFYHFN